MFFPFPNFFSSFDQLFLSRDTCFIFPEVLSFYQKISWKVAPVAHVISLVPDFNILLTLTRTGCYMYHASWFHVWLISKLYCMQRVK